MHSWFRLYTVFAYLVSLCIFLILQISCILPPHFIFALQVQGGKGWGSLVAALYERAGSSPKGRTPNISYFVAKHSTKLLSQKLANTRSPKGLRVSVALFESQLTPATLSWFCSAKSRIGYKKRVIVIVQSNMWIYL